MEMTIDSPSAPPSGKVGTELSIDINNLYRKTYGEDPKHIKYYTLIFKNKPYIHDIVNIFKPYFEKYKIDTFHTESSSIKTTYYDEDESEEILKKSKSDFKKLYLRSLYFNYIDEDNNKFGIAIGSRSRENVSVYIISSVFESEFISSTVRFIMNAFDKLLEKKESIINFICSDSSLYLKSFPIKSNNKKFNLKDLYNDDFIKVSEHIIKELKKPKNNGIVLLHGIPGTGKTSYLRHIVNQISFNKSIIYVPSDLMHKIGSPDFFSFLMDYKNSILILEDSENIIKVREGSESAAVANLLNLTDGIMGDALSFQIICTFNAKIEVIDPALMRSGRMIANYEFQKLNLEKTKRLISKINPDIDLNTIEHGDTLANIFSYNKNSITLKSDSFDNDIDRFSGIKLN